MEKLRAAVLWFCPKGTPQSGQHAEDETQSETFLKAWCVQNGNGELPEKMEIEGNNSERSKQRREKTLNKFPSNPWLTPT